MQKGRVGLSECKKKGVDDTVRKRNTYKIINFV
jgi:hypothetical protein